jgi:hypothetical protein
VREIRNAYRILLGSLMGKDHWEDLNVCRRIILRLIIGKQGGSVWTGFICLGVGNSGGLL